VALAQSVSLASQAARDRDARIALADAARRLPQALAGRRRLPCGVEHKVRVLAEAEQAKTGPPGPAGRRSW
jgi:hypothetical protein